MRITETCNWSTLSFSTFTEAVTFAEAHAYKDREASCCKARPSRGVGDGLEFTGCKDYPSAHALATNGWPEGRARVTKLKAAVSVTARVHRPEVVYDVTGNGGVDVGLVMAGVPECFMDWQESEQTTEQLHGPIVRVVFNGSVAGWMSTEIIENRGAAVLALVDALEASGKRVELIYIKANSVTGGSYDNFLLEIPLKTAEYQSQEDQIVFALVHPSMNRRIGFSLTRQAGRNGLEAAKIGHGGLLADENWRYADADIFLPRLDHKTVAQYRSTANAKTWVLSVLRAQGVEVDAEGGQA